MFARFRNLFSKNKTETDEERQAKSGTVTRKGTGTLTDNANGSSVKNVAYVSSVKQSELEGLNFLKSLVETEQQVSKASESSVNSPGTVKSVSPESNLVQEVEELLNNKLPNVNTNEVLTSKDNAKEGEQPNRQVEIQRNGNGQQDSLKRPQNFCQEDETGRNENNELTSAPTNSLKQNTNGFNQNQKESSETPVVDSAQQNVNETAIKSNETEIVLNKSNNVIENKQKITQNLCELTQISNPGKVDQTPAQNSPSVSNEAQLALQPETETETDSVQDLLKKMKTEVMTLDYLTKASSSLPLEQNETDNAQTPVEETSTEISKSIIIESWVQENNANFIPPPPYPLLCTESATKLDTTHSSIVVEDLPSEVNTPSPTVEGSISGSSSNTSTVGSTSMRLLADPSKIVVNPTGSNGLACNAITGKLTDIAGVAESLDTVIRGIQENSQSAEVESNSSPRDKKMGTLRSTSSEDWHSRSTEDESFVTASEGRTSSFMSCNKSSFDCSEGDDSTLNFEMPDINSPFNMSFDESEQSYLSANLDHNKTPTKLSENGDDPLEDIKVPSIAAGSGNLRSENVTPTPAENVEYYIDSIPIESETELEVAGIVSATPMTMLTESAAVPLSVTPEVSTSSNQVTKRPMLDAAITSPVNGQDITNPSNNNSNNNKPPNVAWRRSKYYENITKQTIKGFL